MATGTFAQALAETNAARYLCPEDKIVPRNEAGQITSVGINNLACTHDYSTEGLCMTHSQATWDGFARAVPVRSNIAQVYCCW